MNLRKLAGFAVGPIGGAALGFLIVPLTAWYFSAEDVGRIAMLQVGISFCLLFFSLGLDQAYVREYHETSDKPALLQACMLPGLGLLLIGVFLFSVDLGALSRLVFGAGSALEGALLSLCLVIAYLSRFLALVLRMEERGLIYSLSQLLPKVGFLAVLGLFIANATGHDFRQLLVAHTVAFASVTLWLLWSTRANWRCNLERLRQVPWKNMMHFGLPLMFSGMAFWGMTSLDRVFLRHFSTFDQLGLYSVACSFAGVAIVLQSIFSTVWAPAIYKKIHEGFDTKQMQIITNQLLSVVVLIFSSGGALSSVFYLILPKQYHDVKYIICACLAYPLLYTLSEATGIGIGIRRKGTSAMIASFAALIVGVSLNFLLAKIYGAAGAAVATCMAFFVLFLLKTEISNKYWIRFNYSRHYFIISICIILSVISAIYKSNARHVDVAWIALFFYACSMVHSSFTKIRKIDD